MSAANQKKPKAPSTRHFEERQARAFQRHAWDAMRKAAAKGNARRGKLNADA